MRPEEYIHHIKVQKLAFSAFIIWSFQNISSYSAKIIYAACAVLFLFFILKSYGIEKHQVIAVNQLGYLPDANKVAMTEMELADSTRFLIIDNKTLSPVYQSFIQNSKQIDPETGSLVHVIDFTPLKKQGSYHIWIPRKKSRSPRFVISDTVYSSIARQAINSFYYQRCGIEVDKIASWYHPACHLDDAEFYNNPGMRKDVTGGWHDAGDYGKFSITTAFSLGYLLYLYERNEDVFLQSLPHLSDSTQYFSDILHHIKWPLDWLLKMQRSDGGVHHKVQKKHWTGEYLPHKDPDERYIFEISSTATAGVAATFALSARLFQSINKPYARRLEEAAIQSWEFLEKHPQVVPKGGFKNPEGVKGGAYTDETDIDERMWAAVELYRLTRAPVFHIFIKKHADQYKNYLAEPLTWKNVFPFAVASYLTMPASLKNKIVDDSWLKSLTFHAEQLVHQADYFSYRTALKPDEFYWGSNGVTAGYAFSLLNAWELTGNNNFRHLAADQLHYLLGRNTHQKVFITGLDSPFVQHPYHQLSMELKSDTPIPGFLVGGPNAYHARSVENTAGAPARWYNDSEKNYPSNEVAINYTASFAYLAGYFADQEHKPHNIY